MVWEHMQQVLADDEPADDVFDPVARADDDEDLVPEDVAVRP